MIKPLHNPPLEPGEVCPGCHPQEKPKKLVIAGAQIEVPTRPRRFRTIDVEEIKKRADERIKKFLEKRAKTKTQKYQDQGDWGSGGGTESM